MEYSFTTIGAVAGLVIAIILIIKKLHPAYSLIIGALAGGIIGGGDLNTTVNTMVSGASGMMSSVLRILTSGILAGALIKTGSAEKIAETIVSKLGEKRAIAAVAIATMIICAVGVFVDISVITVAPIAIAIGKKANISKAGILLAMIGGGKAGNIISPNPNTIAASQTFADTLINAGVPAINSAAMIHAGSTVVDSLPHGSFFHATGGAVSMDIKERMKLIPFEALVGLTSTIVSVIIYLV